MGERVAGEAILCGCRRVAVYNEYVSPVIELRVKLRRSWPNDKNMVAMPDVLVEDGFHCIVISIPACTGTIKRHATDCFD